MKGDFSRSTFDPDKRYTAVVLQQGRVQMDADFNEHVEIQHALDRLARIDEVGQAGTPIGDGFEVQADANGELILKPGHFYVDGMLCVLPAPKQGAQDFRLSEQIGYDLPQVDGVYAFVLDVHERYVDAIEDSEIREVALGGPDHGGRKRLEWRVLAVRLDDDPEQQLTCAEAKQQQAWLDLLAGSTGTLQVRTLDDSTDPDPCKLPARAGYRGRENLLYRVEVHQGNFRIEDGELQQTSDVVTFKWSRDNGSFVTEWLAGSGLAADEVQVRSTGRDDVRRFKAGEWVEFSDLAYELGRRPGELRELLDVREGKLVTTTNAPSINGFLTKPSRVRRWDGPNGAESIVANSWHELDSASGIEIQFGTGRYQTGDYWEIVARSVSGEVSLRSAAPSGPEHHYALLGVGRFVGAWEVLEDCRPQFPAATQLVRLRYVSGDGQAGLPSHELPNALRVGVFNGRFGVAEARVRFELGDPSHGSLRVIAGVTVVTTTSSSDGRVTSMVVETPAGGIAGVYWTLGAKLTVPNQRVRATLIEGGVDGQYIEFGGTIARARDVAYAGSCTHLDSARTVRDALEALCSNHTLHYAGGDGQTGRPRQVLPLKLRVRVANGNWPREGALVRFQVLNRHAYGRALDVDNTGALKCEQMVKKGRGRPGSIAGWYDELVVRTGPDGFASVQWMLGGESRLETQRVRALLLDDRDHETGSELIFSAAIRSSDPIVRLIYSSRGQHGRLLRPGATIKASEFHGLCFEDILVERPTTQPQEWFPGVQVILRAASSDAVVQHFVLPGRTEILHDDALHWMSGLSVFLDAMATNRPVPEAGEPVAEDMRSTVERLGEALHGREPLLLDELELPRPRLIRPEPIEREVPVLVDEAEAEAPWRPGQPVERPGESQSLFLIRVRLQPEYFPDRCAKGAPEFETHFWLDLYPRSNDDDG